MALLTEQQIEQELSGLEGWVQEDNRILREFEFEDFVGSVKFVESLVAPSERLKHHPDLSISWNKVEVRIFDHSEGGLTATDFELAAEIDRLA